MPDDPTSLKWGHPALLAMRELSSLRLSQRSCWSRARRICERIGPYGDIDLSGLRPCMEIAHMQRELRATVRRLGLDLGMEATVATTMMHLEVLHDPSGW